MILPSWIKVWHLKQHVEAKQIRATKASIASKSPAVTRQCQKSCRKRKKTTSTAQLAMMKQSAMALTGWLSLRRIGFTSQPLSFPLTFFFWASSNRLFFFLSLSIFPPRSFFSFLSFSRIFFVLGMANFVYRSDLEILLWIGQYFFRHPPFHSFLALLLLPSRGIRKLYVNDTSFSPLQVTSRQFLSHFHHGSSQPLEEIKNFFEGISEGLLFLADETWTMVHRVYGRWFFAKVALSTTFKASFFPLPCLKR